MYDELVKRLREGVEAFDYEGRVKTASDYKEAADAIKELQAAEKKYLANISTLETENQHLKREREWIPVNEKLPQISYTVLVAGRMKYRWEKEYFHFVDAALFTDEEIFVTFNDWYEGQDEFMITHWMPLPEMPKEE